MHHIVTVNAGNYQGQGVRYTNILYDSVNRNLPEGTPCDFTVLTDDPHGYDAGILVRPLPCHGLEGWWNKIALFQPHLFPAGDRIIYFDLSCVITGRLDALLTYNQPSLLLLQDFFYPDHVQSSIMAWESGKHVEIYMLYDGLGFPQSDPGGDQVWIEEHCGTPILRIQDLFSKFALSYKCDPVIPADASVVVFHGHPKPHECGDWVPAVWRVGGLVRAQLDAICNTNKETLLSNIRHAKMLPHLWFDTAISSHDRPVCIVGGSPSLKQAVPALKTWQQQGAEIWATNGAANYLIEQGLTPNVLVVLDARPENVAFVKHAPSTIRYLIASHCDPSVFAELQDRDVTIFHCHIDGALDLLRDEQARPVHLLGGYTTVGIKAAHLAELSGARTIHLYGMDSCFMEEGHHAYVQTWNDKDVRVVAVYGNRTFSCAPWMVGQAEDFISFVQRFTGLVTVDGPGLLAHIAQCGIPESTADTRAREILSRIGGDPPIGAEIGVFAGDLSCRLLHSPRLILLMVDSWKGEGASYRGESGDFHATLTQAQQDDYARIAEESVRFAQHRAIICRMPSAEAALSVADQSLDFVFIDADHSYEGCKADLNAWAPKVKIGGLLSGHDYENTDFPKFGVTRAVDEWAAAQGYAIEHGDNFTWFITLTKEIADERHNRLSDGSQVDGSVGAIRATVGGR